jgi:hypothetical protein
MVNVTAVVTITPVQVVHPIKDPIPGFAQQRYLRMVGCQSLGKKRK